MFILRFTFTNHHSFRDECDLTLVQSRLQTARPVDGSWSAYTNRVAAIYGPNAAGKSGLLDALRYLQSLVRNSATTWADRKELPRSPFLLDEDSQELPSSYVLNFVIDDIRYEYGVSIDTEAIREEWLYSYPTGRKRVLFERDDHKGLEFGRALKGGESTLKRATGPRELVLSKGALIQNEQLAQLAHHIVEDIDIARFGEMDRQGRLRAFTKDLAEGIFQLDDLRTMLKVADIGISGAEVRQQKADPKFAKFLRAIIQAQSDVNDSDEAVTDEAFDRILSETARVLLFEHLGIGERTYALPSEMQSTGTLTWLSLAAPAIATIKRGGVFVVDEIDASLHPHLAQVMIQMFKDEQINKRHAQLIFTTHDTYFMSPSSEVQLAPDEVFFVEKNREGVSELFCLDQFSTRKDQNLSRRYLQGRYGAIPSVAPAFLSSLIEAEEMTETRVKNGETD